MISCETNARTDSTSIRIIIIAIARRLNSGPGYSLTLRLKRIFFLTSRKDI